MASPPPPHSPSFSDGTLQHLVSPLANEQTYGMFSNTPFLDAGHITCAPPALLPSGMIPTSSNFGGQFEQYMANGALMQPVSTPVMHPNLVSTLKSILSSSPTSSPDQSGPSGASEGSGDERMLGMGCSTGDRFERRYELQQQLFTSPDLHSNLSPHHHTLPSLHAREAEDDEAAVVSVDWIQNRRPFKCAYSGCDKTFKNPQTMKMHHKTHCSEDSANRLAVNAHSLSTSKAGHNKKIPSRCPLCKKTFVGLYELRRHFGRKHSQGEKTLACKKCGKKFYIEVDLRDHEKLCGEPIECKCGMKFAFKCNLVAHKKGHPECQDFSSDERHQQSSSSGKDRHASSRSSSSSSNAASAAKSLSPFSNVSTPMSSPPLLPSLWTSSPQEWTDSPAFLGDSSSCLPLDCFFPLSGSQPLSLQVWPTS